MGVEAPPPCLPGFRSGPELRQDGSLGELLRLDPMAPAGRALGSALAHGVLCSAACPRLCGPGRAGLVPGSGWRGSSVVVLLPSPASRTQHGALLLPFAPARLLLLALSGWTAPLLQGPVTHSGTFTVVPSVLPSSL